MNPLLAVAVALTVMTAVMLALWFQQRRSGVAGTVDVAWTLGVGACGLFFCVVATGGDVTRRIAVAGLIAAWSLRLSMHIHMRLRRMSEDGRYQALKESWGDDAQRRLFWFFQIQALASVFFALPLLAAASVVDRWQWSDWLGVVVWVISWIGESVSDRQLSRFRLESDNRGRVCQSGLWRYSRHPNYFFEWLHWWAYLLFAWNSPWVWATLLAPLAMWYLITKVTGIPPTEAQAVRSRGDAYRAYQQTTNAFFPWRPRVSGVDR